MSNIKVFAMQDCWPAGRTKPIAYPSDTNMDQKTELFSEKNQQLK